MERIRSRATAALRALMRGASRFFPSAAASVLLWALYMSPYRPPDGSIGWPSAGLWAALFMGVPARLAQERFRPRRGHAAVCAAAVLAFAVWAGLFYAYDTSGLQTHLTVAFAGFLLLCVALSYALLMDADNEHTLLARIAGALAYGIVPSMLAGSLLWLCLAALRDLFGVSMVPAERPVLALCMIVLPVNLFLSRVPHPGEKDERAPPEKLVAAAAAFYLAFAGILLAYAARIVLTRRMPVGVMNGYASCALAFYLALWMTRAPLLQNAVCRAYARFGGVALLPVAAVQIYGIAVRFAAYGLTTARYVSMVCLALGLFALIRTLRRHSLRPVCAAVCAAIALLTSTPLNAIDVPVMEQEARLKSLLRESGLLDGDTILGGEPASGETAARIYSCVDYLRDAPSAHRSAFWRENLFMERGRALADRFRSGEDLSAVTYSYRVADRGAPIRVSGYAWVEPVELYRDTEMILRLTLPTEKTLAYDLRGVFEDFALEHGEDETTGLRFDLDEKTTLALNWLDVRMTDAGIAWCGMSGLALIRE